MSSDLIVQLAQGVYDGITVLRFPDGSQAKAYYKIFNDVEVLFDGNGRAWLNPINIARLLNSDRQTVGRAIANLGKSGHLPEDSHHVITLLTRLDSTQGSYDRELEYYDHYVMNLIAGRMQKPSPEALQYLEWRETIFDEHQAMIHQLRLEAINKQTQLQLEVESLEATVQDEHKELAKAKYWEFRTHEQARFMLADLRHELPIENVED